MRDSKVKQEKEERNAAENNERVSRGEVHAFEESESDERGTESHQEEEERGRIFGGVEKGERGEERGACGGPGGGIAIAI
jgi:hypothetical protein